MTSSGWLIRYAAAVLLTALSFGLRLALYPWLGLSFPYLPFFPAIMLAGLFGGLGPGLLATGLAAAVVIYFVLPPIPSFAVAAPSDVISVPLFLVIGAGMSWLAESRRRADAAQRHAAALAEARARELDAIFDAIPDGIYVGDAHGIQRCNAAGLRLLGAGSLADLQMPHAERVARFRLRSAATGAPLDPEELSFAKALRGETVIHEVVAGRADTGADVVLRTSAAPVRRDGRIVGAVTVNTDITAQHRMTVELAVAAEAVEQAKRRLVEVVANVPGVVWEAWGQPDEATQRIDFVSDYVEVMLGYSPAEWLATPNFWLKIVHPDDRARAAAEARAIFESGGGGRSEFRWLARDGRVVWVEAQSRVILNADGRAAGMRGVTMDVTARRQAEEARARATEQVHLLATISDALAATLDYDETVEVIARKALPRLGDFCAVVVFEADGQGRLAACAHVDPALEALLRRQAEAGLESPAGRGLRSRAASLREAVFSPGPGGASAGSDKFRWFELSGDLRSRSTLIVPLIVRGTTLGLMTFGLSVSGRTYGRDDAMLAEEVAGRAAIGLENANLYRQARELNRLKDEFLATLSHELRTPINAVLGWTQMLKAGAVTPERTVHALEAIERNAWAQQHLIEDLLDVSRIITGKLRVDVRHVDLAGVVAAAVEAVQPAAASRQIRLQVVTDEPVRHVRGDAQRLQQAVWNLLSNAVKFTPPSGTVDVRLRRSGANVEIVVSDNGQGIAPEVLPHVFERFQQADSSTTRAYTGLGLGLAIVRHLVELHGGTVEAASEGLGRGATFRIRLPAVLTPLRTDPAAAAGEAADPTARARLAGNDLDGLTILMVEDDAETREIVTDLLRRHGASVRVATSADEALGLFELETPDLVLSDIEMPDRDGYSLMEAIRGRPRERGGGVRAVALTAYARAEDRARALGAGFDAHVAKPIDLRELVATVAQVARDDRPQTAI